MTWKFSRHSFWVNSDSSHSLATSSPIRLWDAMHSFQALFRENRENVSDLWISYRFSQVLSDSSIRSQSGRIRLVYSIFSRVFNQMHWIIYPFSLTTYSRKRCKILFEWRPNQTMLKYIIVSTIVLLAAISISFYFRQVCTQSFPAALHMLFFKWPMPLPLQLIAP